MTKAGEVYAHESQYGVYAKVDEIVQDEARISVRFSVWDITSPGWQGGAGLSLKEFRHVYSDGPYPESCIPSATAMESASFLFAKENLSFEEGEKYAVSLSSTHWEALETTGCLKGWVKARELGLTPAQCDLIVLAAVKGVRQNIELWAHQEQEAAEEADLEDERYGPRPSYRCYITRHSDCELNGSDSGCTCNCHEEKSDGSDG